MTAFYVLGILLALWAVLVAALGISRRGFPGSSGGTRIVMGVSVVLVLAAVGSAIVGSALEEEEHGEVERAAEETRGEEAPAAPAAGGGESADGGEELELSADPTGELSFDTDALEAKAGDVTLVMTNPSALEHDVSLEGDGVDQQGEVVPQGGTSTVSADLKPGEYTFYCSVPGHREGGMEGTLTVD